MAYTKHARKAALAGMDKKMLDIALAVGVDASLVSHVIAGRRWTGPDARKVMEYVAGLIGAPVDEVFPGSERRRGDDRRGPFAGSKAAA
jgi:hypothetical protein